MEQKIRNAKATEQTIPVFETARKHYTSTVHYQIYQLANRSPNYDDTISSYIAKLRKKINRQ